MYFIKENGKVRGNFATLKDGQYKAVEVKSTRSLQINRYYRVLLTLIAKEYAEYGHLYIEDYLHTCFKKALLPRVRIKSDFGKKYVYQMGTTTTLTNKKFTEYLKQIKALAEFGQLHQVPGLEEIAGFVLPDANDTNLLTYIDNLN